MTSNIEQTTDTFSRFRELQRSAGQLPTSSNGMHRVYLVHGEQGNVLEIGFATDAQLAIMKATERIVSNTLNAQLLEARGVLLEHTGNVHYPKHEHAIDPEHIETPEQLEANYYSAEAILTIGADSTGCFMRGAILPGHAIPVEALDDFPVRDIQRIDGDHPMARLGSILETMALAIDTARQIIERDGVLPERPLDD